VPLFWLFIPPQDAFQALAAESMAEFASSTAPGAARETAPESPRESARKLSPKSLAMVPAAVPPVAASPTTNAAAAPPAVAAEDRSLWSSVRDAHTLMSVVGWCGFAGLVFHIFVLYMLQTALILEQFIYYVAIFDVATANELVNAYAVIFFIAGLPVSLFIGFVANYVSPEVTVMAWDATAMLTGIAAAIPRIASQYVSMLGLTLCSNVYYLAAPPLVMRYTPLELFGTVFGAVQTLIGVLQIGLVSFENWLTLAYEPDDLRLRMIWKLSFWMGAIVLASVVNVCAWRSSPPPRLGSVTMAAVRAARTYGPPVC